MEMGEKDLLYEMARGANIHDRNRRMREKVKGNGMLKSKWFYICYLSYMIAHCLVVTGYYTCRMTW